MRRYGKESPEQATNVLETWAVYPRTDISHSNRAGSLATTLLTKRAGWGSKKVGLQWLVGMEVGELGTCRRAAESTSSEESR